MERVAKDQLLARIRDDRASFDRVLSVVPSSRLTDPVLPGGWSVKDVLAHIAWGDREAIRVIRSRAMAGSQLWALSEDERNAAVVRASRSQPLETVLVEYRDAFDSYVAALEDLREADMNEPAHIEGLAERIPGWRPWRVLYDPNHYAEHRRTLEATFGKARSPG